MEINKYTLFKYYSGLTAKIYVFLRSVILLIEEIERYIPAQGLIYDIGCGYGLTSLYLALKSEERKIIGIDINEKRIKQANKNIARENLSFEEKDLTKDRDIQPCDCILIYDLLHHIPYSSQNKLLLTCKERLKQKGIILIKEIDNRYKFKLLYTYILDKIVTKNAKLYYSSSQNMISQLQKIGFTVQYKRLRNTWPYPHYLLIAKK